MIDDQLKKYTVLKAELDHHSHCVAEIKADIEIIKTACLEHAEVNGLEKFGANGVSVTIKEKLRPTYEPDRWPDIMLWCVENDMQGVIQRRLSADPLVECIENGVAFPEGLTMTPVTEVSLRRSK